MVEQLSGWLGNAASTVAVVTLVCACITLVCTGWVLTLLGMPGNWLIAVVALVYNLLAPEGSRLELGQWTVITTFALAALGEALESLAGAMGVARKGGSRRGAVGALVGSLVGALLGVLVGLPVPIVGSVLAAVVFASGGALVGTMIAETTTGKDLPTSVDIGVAAMWGRLFGSIAKTIVGGVMVAVVIVGIVW
jgi:uncharacterized protein YqgC (DUF456 family)